MRTESSFEAFCRWWGRLDPIWLSSISLFLFVPWLIAAHGWVRAVGVIWLIYPAITAKRLIYQRSR